ncbi:hypothetical protein PTSG_09521 [Salpingoeca rosetta]|uniref:WW domain-containing protein n=1 Tax=Salpingoeca rosetta (strain ATCC 50818 / BSB-021) TaxID=946362 RepID=F2UL88_SALR5|nr:uncharacterized protein PTSG_09521 [Salpingoeca rosetta]EGD77887.1 hypothetical protein PTSG_09521 [Salpingoeca rosetta]|eukprot:XP_004989951.1 hypothetical protein PTSG_09521 [Salpingoeca rosetta]
MAYRPPHHHNHSREGGGSGSSSSSWGSGPPAPHHQHHHSPYRPPSFSHSRQSHPPPHHQHHHEHRPPHSPFSHRRPPYPHHDSPQHHHQQHHHQQYDSPRAQRRWSESHMRMPHPGSVLSSPAAVHSPAGPRRWQDAKRRNSTSDGANKWTVHTDSRTGRTYYFNTETRTSQWHKPAELHEDGSGEPTPKRPPPSVVDSPDMAGVRRTVSMPASFSPVGPANTMSPAQPSPLSTPLDQPNAREPTPVDLLVEATMAGFSETQQLWARELDVAVHATRQRVLERCRARLEHRSRVGSMS